MNQSVTVDVPPIMKRLIKGIDNEARMDSPTRSPTDDATSDGIDNGRDVTKPCQVAYLVKPGSQSMFGAGAKKGRFTPVERAWAGLVTDRRADRSDTNNALQPHHPHKPRDGRACDVEALPLQLPPGFAHATDLEILIEHPAYLDLQTGTAEGADRQAIHVQALGTIS